MSPRNWTQKFWKNEEILEAIMKQAYQEHYTE